MTSNKVEQSFKSENINQNLKTLKTKVRSQPYTLTKPTKIKNKEPIQSTKSNNNAFFARINSMNSKLRSLFDKSVNGAKIYISNLKIKKNHNVDDNLKKTENVDYSLKLSTSTTTTSNLFDNCLNDCIKTLPKWTCLICLNKNDDPMDLYCLICGSAKTSPSLSGYSNMTSDTIIKPSFQKPIKTTIIFSDLTNSITSKISTTVSTENSTIRKLPKTWLCLQCSYANDNLKIVCVNCRTPKSDLKSDIMSQQIRLKISHSESPSTASSERKSRIAINKSVNDNDDKLKQQLFSFPKDQLCLRCQHPIDSTKYKIDNYDLVTPKMARLLKTINYNLFQNTNASLKLTKS
jgi:hypothetical protein